MEPRDVRLPPLNALRVFHAVMRRLSFRAAADELLVTPQAVSQQIKALEEALAVSLFDRRARVVEPTEAAILLSHYVEAGFQEFSEGVRRVTRASHRYRINVNASPYFATRFLIDRLEGFRARLPGADLRLTTWVDLPDFAADEVDVSIQWGFGGWRDFECRLLLRDPKIICCAPSLAARVATPEDLTRATLLHLVLGPQLWRRALNFLDVEARGGPGEITFHDAASMRQATIAGLGIGLISELDAGEDIATGRLVAPLGAGALAAMDEADVPGFYLVVPKAHRRVRAVAAFCDWLTGEDWIGAGR
jgi:LysR family transcriptional regulator, glycine cleavage system transcriptional activator